MATKKKSPAKKHSRPRKSAKLADGHETICFTIMPFGKLPDQYYAEIYSPAIKDAGLVPLRADDFNRPTAITHDIWVLTSQAKLILADLTGKNPNVFYELGLGHALAKPAILVTDVTEEKEIPFDLRSLRIILYDKDHPKWGEKLKDSIQKAITEVLNSTESASLPSFLIENQIRSLEQELALVKRKGPRRTRKNAHDTSASAAQPDGTTLPENVPRISRADALDFVQHLMAKKPLPPDHFIMSVLTEDKGFTAEQARSILAEARDQRSPPLR